MDLVQYITKLQTNVFAIRNDDDFADRLNYRYTVAILVAFAIIVSNRQFSETVIKCWVPAFFTPNYEAYANQVCWISNTYYVNQTTNVPKSEESRKSHEIKYYQWIPFILLIQALFLYIPRILWRLLSSRAGLDLRDLIEAAHSYKSVEKFTNKKKIMDYIVENIDQYATNPRRSKPIDSIFQKLKYFGESLFCGSGIYLGNYLVTTYFFIKLAYLFNSIIQFFVMNEFLGKQFHELGMDIVRYLTNTYSLDGSIDSVYFPKVVMCDFRIREFGHPNFSHRYTIQCVLPINLYNQQIFTFLWFWFLILFCANFWALCQWINRMLPKSRRRYIYKRLNMLKYFKELDLNTSVVIKKGHLFPRRVSVSPIARNIKKKFVNEYLKFDGVFIIRMISMLTSEIIGTELLHELWNKRALSQNKLIDSSNMDNMDNNDNIDYPFDPVHNQPEPHMIYDNHDTFTQKVEEYLNQRSESLPSDNLDQKLTSIKEETNDYIVEKPKKSKLSKLKQQFSVDLISNTPLNRLKLKRLLSQSSDNSQSQVTQMYQNDENSFNPRQSILYNKQANNANDRPRHKKVVFSPSTNLESPKTESNLNDIDDVFSDLKLDNLN